MPLGAQTYQAVIADLLKQKQGLRDVIRPNDYGNGRSTRSGFRTCVHRESAYTSPEMTQAHQHLLRRIQASQSEMQRVAADDFTSDGLDDLRCVIRLTVEFAAYLDDPDLNTVENDRRVQEIKTKAPDGDISAISTVVYRGRSRYQIESIFSGIDSYASLTHHYHVLRGATPSAITGDEKISVGILKDQFREHFIDFETETDFLTKCRLLLDLFKLQIIFAGMLYD